MRPVVQQQDVSVGQECGVVLVGDIVLAPLPRKAAAIAVDLGHGIEDAEA